MAEIDFKSLLFDGLDPCMEPWPRLIPEVRFSMVWTSGRNHGQNQSQKLDFQYFGPLGGNIAKIDPRSLTFDILDPSAEPRSKSIPEICSPA